MKRNNNGGYALLWTVIVLMLGSIFVAAALQLSSSMTKRSLSQNNRNQAYFTALSVVDTIVREFSGPLVDGNGNGASAIAALEKLGKDGTVRVTSIRGLPKEMGSCNVEITRKGLKLYITANAKSGGDSYSLTAVMGGTIVNTPTIPSEGLVGLGLGSLGGLGNNKGSLYTDENTKIYIWDATQNTVFGGNDWGNKNILQEGSFYSKGSLKLLDNDQRNHLHGEIVCDGDITITGAFSVGPLNGKCTNMSKAKPSYVYTMGKADLSMRAHVVGNVTATTFNIKDSAQVEGRVTADVASITPTISDGSITIDASGDPDGIAIKANTVTLSGDTRIKGDIVADEVTLTDRARVEGNIRANTVVLGTDAHIAGEVTGNAVTISLRALVDGNVTADSLTMTDTGKIVGDVTANTIVGGGNNTINGKLTCNVDNYNGVLSNGMIIQGVMPPPCDGNPVVEPLTSKVPDPEPTPSLTPPDTAAELSDGDRDITISGGSGKARTYVVKDDIELNSLTITDKKPVVIFVEDGQKLLIRQMHVSNIDPDNLQPNLFIILGRGSKLTLGKEDGSSGHFGNFYLYVWGERGNGSKVDIGKDTSVYGGINVDEIIPPDNGNTTNEFFWKDPGNLDWMGDLTSPEPPPDPEDPDDPEDPEDPSEDDVIVWELTGYTDK